MRDAVSPQPHWHWVVSLFSVSVVASGPEDVLVFLLYFILEDYSLLFAFKFMAYFELMFESAGMVGVSQYAQPIPLLLISAVTFSCARYP